MEGILPILGIVVLLAYIVNEVNKGEVNKEDEEEPEKHPYDEIITNMYNDKNVAEMYPNQNEEKPITLHMMLDSLKQLGCQPLLNDDDTVSVKYQGENFQIDFCGVYARVWDTNWAYIEVNHPEIPKIRAAVNDANYSFGPTVLLSDPDDDGFIRLHSRRDIMLHPSFPDCAQYINTVLDSFFYIKEQFHRSYDNINAKQQESQKNRRPIGFTTSSQNTENELS